MIGLGAQALYSRPLSARWASTSAARTVRRANQYFIFIFLS